MQRDFCPGLLAARGADQGSPTPLPGSFRLRYNQWFLPLLGGRSMVGHAALDRVIGVRIPASQPVFPLPNESAKHQRLQAFPTNRRRRRLGNISLSAHSSGSEHFSE